MRETFRRLVALQRVDDELARVETEVGELPGRREAAEAERASTEAQAAQAGEALEARELEQRRLEAELADLEEKVRRLEGQTSQVKSNEAYHALLREIEEAKTGVGALEEQILEVMDAAGDARGALVAAQERAHATSEGVTKELASLEARGSELAQSRDSLTAARDAEAEALDPAVRSLYWRAAQHRRPAVVVISKELCSGCLVGIPPQDFVDLISAKSVVECRTCRRLLVHEKLIADES